MIDIEEIHKTRVLTLEECDILLNARRQPGRDLDPEVIMIQQRQLVREFNKLNGR